MSRNNRKRRRQRLIQRRSEKVQIVRYPRLRDRLHMIGSLIGLPMKPRQVRIQTTTLTTRKKGARKNASRK